MTDRLTTTIRPARPEDRDAVADLVYLTAGDAYDLFAGSREAAVELIRAAFERDGTDASRDVVTVAEVNGRVAGAMAAFPVAEGRDRSGRFLRMVLRMRPPWRWGGVLRLWWAGTRGGPRPPFDSLYVDALATHPEFRRRGIALALLDEAERAARDRGLAQVALDTAAGNTAARLLYERAGFVLTEERRARGPIPALVGFAKRVA
ncbi:MAG TPA: GNAT family N-acetyltransferase [Thermoleophilaceae bacterium]